jgi:hypothetical protein
VGFACVGSPFQHSLELRLFLDKKCNITGWAIGCSRSHW